MSNMDRMDAILMMAMLLVLALIAPKANAREVFTAQPGQPFQTFTIWEEPCANDTVLANIALKVRPEYATGWQKAELVWIGKSYAACWKELNDTVYGIDEEGATIQPIPRSRFLNPAL